MSRYAIRGGAEGKRRLELLAQSMAPTTSVLLAEVGVHAGSRCVDLGCGAGHVARYLTKLVGPTGHVLGIDFDAVKVAAAQAGSDPSRFPNLEFRVANVAEWVEPDGWDLVYGRFILSHLTDRKGVVGRAVASVRLGGTVVFEDIDFAGTSCYPPDKAFQLYSDWYCAVIARRGGDALLGPQLQDLCLDAGLQEVRLRMVQPVHTGDAPGKALSLSTLVNIRDAVLAEGLATTEELDEAIAQLGAFTADRSTLIGYPRIFQVWGRRPARPAP